MSPEEIEEQIRKCKPYINKLALRYCGPNNLEDLCQEGVIGVILAAKTFDPSYGVKFLTFAAYHIKKQMLLYLKKELRYIPVEDVTELIDDYVPDYVERVALARNLQSKAVDSLKKKKVSERDIDIIMSRYLNPRPSTLQSLADRHNVTRQRVKQVEDKWRKFLQFKLGI